MNIVPFTVLAKVVTPATFTLSKFVCPSTSKSFAILTTPPIVLIPDVPPPPVAVIVTIPADTGDTDRFVPKSMVPAVPTNEPLSLITTPEPEATIPDNPEPSPTNLVAVTTPVILISPVPVIDLLNKSKFPPS